MRKVLAFKSRRNRTCKFGHVSFMTDEHPQPLNTTLRPINITMIFSSRLRHCAVSLLTITGLLSEVLASNITARTLLNSFSPPVVFENTNLVRNINLEKSYPRETTNIVVKNIAKDVQTEYYLQFPSELAYKVSGLEVKDKKNADGASFFVELAQYASPGYVHEC
jgi:hypothetical protein